ncbi:MAG TPA: aminodeoxychorismate/anthranilate synthase component II [Oceanicaulis sp.]|jgi:anthranilate synthase component 2|uniref:Aminodeoxychorismate/anthranilate synthase component II n=1 Tax=Glycocaulis albus TaxID=1382801 RepID=A0ABQ1XHI4_9PROT|nr:aminodeoxychorismate/anthranilate synthase component II [Glycocaulis albus]MBV5258669.1 aminodeoxychorismate/anthranilate synthase component II [Synechococcus moorigangaii CMS01]GGG93616.1 aminodeoxychorismate/anthranilate synthase component II [Glycocaulis albus]HCY56760.1 aminodeoxychorismate/anthranilate synthase component II [Oceanicaulis sp.]
MLLIIDNYDSFTFNLVHYFQELGAQTRVIRNDAMSAAEALGLGAQAIVLSPGPCDPDRAGICLDVLREAPANLPVLGVCLGHQAMGQVYGGKVVQAREIMHGKTSPIIHDGTGVFAGLSSPFNATRYHSLAVELPEGSELIVNARTADGEIMGLRHHSRPVHGVQFHPESIASEHGHSLLKNFLAEIPRQPGKAAA